MAHGWLDVAVGSCRTFGRGKHPGGVAESEKEKAIHLQRKAGHALEDAEEENKKDQGFELGDFELV